MPKETRRAAASGAERSLDIKLAAMSLLWNNPNGERLVPWLKQVKEAGYDGVAGFADWGWEQYIGDPGSFGRMLSDHGLGLASVDANIYADFDRYRLICDFMAALECRHLVCLGGFGREEGDLAALGSLLNRIGEIALERGARASYHHHTFMSGETFEEMDRLLSETDPEKLFVMCDTGHATKDFINQPVEERAVSFMKKYWDRLDLIEFKDWSPETDLNTPLGEGQCNYEAVFALLKDKGYSGWITVEQNGHEGLSRGRQPIECARISREFIRQGLGI